MARPGDREGASRLARVKWGWGAPRGNKIRLGRLAFAACSTRAQNSPTRTCVDSSLQPPRSHPAATAQRAEQPHQMAAPAVVAARSLAEAYALREVATALLLRGHADLRCVNIMCEQVGRGCACRLALSLSRMRALRRVDVARNALPTLPASLFELPALEAVSAGGNALREFPAAALQSPTLVALDLSGNAISAVPWEAWAAAATPAAATGGGGALRRVVLTGNPIPPAEVERGRALLPHVDIVTTRTPAGLEELLEGLGAGGPAPSPPVLACRAFSPPPPPPRPVMPQASAPGRQCLSGRDAPGTRLQL